MKKNDPKKDNDKMRHLVFQGGLTTNAEIQKTGSIDL